MPRVTKITNNNDGKNCLSVEQ